MDFHLKQPIEKQQFQDEDEESDQEQHQPSPAKLPKLESQNDTALPLFASHQQQQQLNLNTSSATYPDSKPPLPPPTSRFPCMYQAAGYWSKANMDPEPGRCRRTDGKKWRCSRDVVAGHKYCERHVHRGRNRSRKPVESSIPAAASITTTASSPKFRQSGLVGGDGTLSLSGPTSSLDIFQLNQGAADPKPDGKSLFKAQNDQSGDGTSKLRHFFDDWPKPDNTGIDLSISTPGENASVDFLKLSTGNGGDQLRRSVDEEWSGGDQADAMGGPLAEALRSSTGGSATAVLHQLPQSGSGASCVTA